jgi:FtsH-binding integral membrane protein
MSQSYPYPQSRSALGASADRRARFIVRTYNHLFGAIVLFTLLEFGLFMSGAADMIARLVLGGGQLLWLGFIAAFMLVGWFATRFAHTATSKPAQYFGLGAYVLMEALLFVPLLWIAEHYAPSAIPSAGLVTMVGFAGLTGIAFWTRKDFSFLGGIVRWGFVCALLLIVAAAIFGLQLGVFFSVALVGLAGASILYDTSNVIHHYPEDRYVGAALQLFASVAVMFYYILRLFLSARR